MRKAHQLFKTIVLWLPSLIITLFYISNAFNKLLEPNQTGKVVENGALMFTAGVFLVVATVLFLYDRTALLGAGLLALYMTFIVTIHLYKGKPTEVAILIVMSTIFAAYIRTPKSFHKKED